MALAPTSLPMPPGRLLLDTNVVVSAMLWGGPPRYLLNLALDGQLVLVSSTALLAELRHTLGYARLAKRLALLNTSVATLMQEYQAIVTLVQLVEVAPVIPDDPDDDVVVATALAGQAELIVSGDRHLLKLQSHAGIAIVTARVAWERLTPKG